MVNWMKPEERRKICGRSYTPEQERRESLAYTLKGISLAFAIGFVTQATCATVEAHKKFNVLKEDFMAASISKNDKALNDIVAERETIEREYWCIPQSWIAHKSYPVEFNDSVCFKYSK